MLLYGLGKYQYVIQIDEDTLVQQMEECTIHYPLEGRGCIAKAKGHNREFKTTIPSTKGSLKCVLRCHGYLMIPIPQVKLAKDTCPTELSQQIIYAREGVTIKHSIGIQGTIINAHAQLIRILLFCKQDRGPIRAAAMCYPP